MKIKIKDVWHYIVGNVRYRLFYSKFKILIPKHIREQIEYRINSMNPECYYQGSCIMCGCKTTALQMANKMCDNPCYPKMLNREVWTFWKVMDKCFIKVNEFDILWKLDLENKKFVRNE